MLNCLFPTDYIHYSAIEAGGWDYECLLEWEKQEQAEGPTKLLDWIKHKSPQDWDSVQRGWLYIQLKDLLDQPPIREETAIKYTQLFWPDDWSKATPYNCFWLRFPDCSPLMPWRQYGTMTMITEWYKVRFCPFNNLKFAGTHWNCQMNKRKIATYKSRMTSLKISETAAGRLMKKPERSDNDVVNKLLNGPKRPRGYRAYTNTPEFRDLMAVEIAKRMKAIQEEQGDPHLDFRTQEKFKLREAFKHKAWKELPASEKAKWENIASQKAQSDVDNMTKYVFESPALSPTQIVNKAMKLLLHFIVIWSDIFIKWQIAQKSTWWCMQLCLMREKNGLPCKDYLSSGLIAINFDPKH